jgi:Tfp pilus assembly protein PilN
MPRLLDTLDGYAGNNNRRKLRNVTPDCWRWCAAHLLLQLQYTWQALTVEGSPFKQDTTLNYLMDKLNSYSSLSSASLSSSDEELAESAAAAATAEAAAAKAAAVAAKAAAAAAAAGEAQAREAEE